ncbi:MAG: glycosyltransferase, partial [Aliifodinibius sp.]|nr:glycosyltransferase family 2 protein [Fodinibius sp.]NIV15338.1 glycosyltransferase [Fodinibius sp.]NIY29207.1 glycosyltransferase [Fodinibius sp.]
MMLNISIIIPTFNRKNLLERALTSVTTQTRPTEEIIVVDDGSEDETESLVRKQFPDVRYFRQQNRGVSSARNLGIRQATGNWIAFLDSDDEWLPQKLEKQC